MPAGVRRHDLALGSRNEKNRNVNIYVIHYGEVYQYFYSSGEYLMLTLTFIPACFRYSFTFFIVALMILLSQVSLVHAASITVNASCSLPDAITAADTDTATGDCPAGSGADTITLTGDIVLSQALPTISSDITIGGAGYSISGDSAHRIFEVVYPGALTLENITLKEGLADSGGAIYNAGTLTIRRRHIA